MFLIGGNLGVSALSFVRNVLIARMLSLEDFGISATFSIVVTFIELVGNFALDRFLIQARDGDDERVQATVHVFHLLRGAIASSLLFALANPIAVAFKVPEIAWAYQVMALVPLVRGFVHFDMARAQRHMSFLPITMVELVPQIVSAVLVVPFAWYLKDFRAVLGVVLLQTVSFVVVSHIVSTRRYQWHIDAAVLHRILSFGWPLVVSSLLLFVVSQGDRMIVGTLMSVKTLGWFSAAFLVTSVSAGVVGRVCLTFFLPILSSARDDISRFEARAAVMINLCLVLGVLYAMAVAIAVPSLLLLLFGEAYAPALDIIPWLGAIHGISIARVAPATVAMARGNTVILMFANIIRVAFMGIGFFVMWIGMGLTGLMISTLAGGIVAFAATMVALHTRLALPIKQYILPTSISLLIISVTMFGAFEWVTGRHPGMEIAVLFPMAFLALGLCLAVMPGLIRECRAIWFDEGVREIGSSLNRWEDSGEGRR